MNHRVTMSTIITQPSTFFAPELPDPAELPDHTQLPDKDGNFVRNWLEPPQSALLNDSLEPVLETLFPDKQYTIGNDSGIYWKLTDPPLDGCKSPDWYLILGVPPMLAGKRRRSYVMWKERKVPLIAIEYVSGDGSEERDRTPQTGKFWVYEHEIQIPYYAIYEAEWSRLEVNRLVNRIYEKCEPNERGHYPIAPLGVELGIWDGVIANMDGPWLRWWDANGNLLLSSKEKTEAAGLRIQVERQRAESAEERAKVLAEKLRFLGIDPDKP